ncbi:CHAT domain-containing protein [Nioella sp. MMSF_3534]|uniref:CHAT domain-containing protein n=1 Tax=Nioella sp. MMSF_3534 TaxID=3046720 RepID=UPI0027400A06|nr:CHAT domain-containing protein [Nioella sp. MMSF_3534]
MRIPTEKEAKAAFSALSNADPDRAAGCWIILGNFLLEYDRAPWCEFGAKYCFERALHDLEEGKALPRQLADALLGFGAALTDEGSGYRDKVLFEAIRHLDRAIAIYQELEDNVAILNARFYRGYALSEIVGPERYSAAQSAVDELKEVRASFRAGDDRIIRANVDSILGSAYLDLVEGDPWENLSLAEQAFRSALHVFSRAQNDEGMAQGYLNLAVVYNMRQILGDAACTPKAIKYARRSLKHSTKTLPPEVLSSTLSNLARALADSGGRQQASNIRKAETLLSEAITASDTAGVEGGDVLRLVRAGLIIELCQYHGANRMGDAMADIVATKGKFDPLETTQWWLEWHELEALYLSISRDFAEVIKIAEHVLEQTRGIVEQTSTFAEQSHQLGFVSVIADLGVLAYLKEKGPAAALEYARKAFGRLLGFNTKPNVQPEGTAELYLLNPVVEGCADVLLAEGGFVERYTLEGVGKSFWTKATDRLEAGFFAGMEEFLQHGRRRPMAIALEEWILKISDALGPVLSNLRDRDFEEVVIFAFGGWCTVPIAALQFPREHGAARQVIDDMSVAFGPDQYLPHPIDLGHALHIVDFDLCEARQEARTLQDQLRQYTACSTLRKVQQHLSGSSAFDVIHFTTHGSHDFDYLEGAGIRCADGEVLTARWVFENAKLKGGPLVCLAACQTGLPDFSNLPHETFGLPTAFLVAGASAVISTQWPVDDVASRHLMHRLYQYIGQGQPVSAALRAAQIWLRDAEARDLDAISTGKSRFSRQGQGHLSGGRHPFSHPYFWAGFQLHRA